MDLQLEPLDRAKTYELVVRKIHGEIFAGRLRPGDRLPGERQLSELLNVSRPSVREAIRILQAMGIVRSRPGVGAGSGLVVSTEASKALSELLRLHVALSSYSIVDVLYVRAALEEQAVRTLAERIEETDTSRLRQILERMSEPELDPATFHDLDTDFHVELARASNNTFLADLMGAMRDAVFRTMADIFESDLVSWPERLKQLVDEHQQIFAAVSAGEPDRAVEVMRSHIDGLREWLRDSPVAETQRSGE